jgi:hypothetical protein
VHNELHNLCSINIVRMIKSRIMRWEDHAACMVEQANPYKSDGTKNLKQRNHLGDHVARMVEQGNPYSSRCF